MTKVIFICRGNLIRSQICKALYNHMSKDSSFAESYGTDVEADGNDKKKLKDFDHLSNLVKIMKNHGMDISEEIPKQLIEESIKNASKIIYMGRRKNIPDWMSKYNYEYWEDCLNEIEKNKDFNLNIRVPKFGDEKDIEDTINLLKNKVETLIK